MEFVVRAQRRQGTGADAVGEEDLRGTVYPGSGAQQLLPARCDVVEQTLVGTVECHSEDQEYQQHSVGEQGCEPDDLQTEATGCSAAHEIVCISWNPVI